MIGCTSVGCLCVRYDWMHIGRLHCRSWVANCLRQILNWLICLRGGQTVGEEIRSTAPQGWCAGLGELHPGVANRSCGRVLVDPIPALRTRREVYCHVPNTNTLSARLSVTTNAVITIVITIVTTHAITSTHPHPSTRQSSLRGLHGVLERHAALLPHALDVLDRLGGSASLVSPCVLEHGR